MDWARCRLKGVSASWYSSSPFAPPAASAGSPAGASGWRPADAAVFQLRFCAIGVIARLFAVGEVAGIQREVLDEEVPLV